jgi:hypothetical protein
MLAIMKQKMVRWFCCLLVLFNPLQLFLYPGEHYEKKSVYKMGKNSINPDATISSTISFPLVLKNYCSPSIAITVKPPYDTYQDLQGLVACAQPSDYKVAVYIYDSGWKNKPSLDAPLTNIQNNGTWVCDITTELYDSISTGIAAFLVPNGYNPPLLSRVNPLPVELFENAVAYTIEDRAPIFRQIQFSGYTWKVKYSETMDGPGPNYFSDRPDDVWVDTNGKLHLKVAYHDGKWYSTELITVASFGYGSYTFKLATKPDILDKNVVLGLFTWDDSAPQDGYREFDIEFSRWGQDINENSQYWVEPQTYNGGYYYRFNMISPGDYSTHRFIWSSSDITFSSYYGLTPDPGNQIASWVYNGPDLAQAGQGNVRIDLWQIDGQPPSDGQPVEVVIDSFSFVAP